MSYIILYKLVHVTWLTQGQWTHSLTGGEWGGEFKERVGKASISSRSAISACIVFNICTVNKIVITLNPPELCGQNMPDWTRQFVYALSYT